MNLKLIFIIILLPVLAFGIYWATIPPIAGDLANGRNQYEAHCLVCHGKKGLGDGVAAAGLAEKPANIALQIANPLDRPQSIIADILAGKVDKGMPSFNGVISNRDAQDILAYIESLQ